MAHLYVCAVLCRVRCHIIKFDSGQESVVQDGVWLQLLTTMTGCNVRVMRENSVCIFWLLVGH